MKSSETKRGKFQKLANNRVNRILNDLRLVGNLANKSHYEYSENEINEIFHAINEQLKLAQTEFKSKKRRFKL